VVRDSNNNIVASGVGSDDTGQGYVQVVVSFTGVPGETYTATSVHSLFEIYTVECYNDGDPQPIFLGYDDMYNFGFFSGDQGLYEGSYEWDGPGPETFTRSRHEVAGETVDTKTNAKLACSPTPVVRGSTITCTASGSGASFSNWQFTDGTNVVTSATGTTAMT
jgi:hypothetical protein